MNPEIYHLLSEAVEQKKDVKLINTYRSVPVSTNGQIIELHGNEARITTSLLQIICGRNQNISYINIGFQTLIARVTNSDLNEGSIDFSDFEICNNHIGKRKFIRVEPDNLLKAQITSPEFNPDDQGQDKWFNAWLVDLSIHGAAIYVHPLIFNKATLGEGDSACLKFNLTNPGETSANQVELKAVIRNTTSIEDKYIRIGLETNPDPASENFLTSYVAHLQKKIIKELREKLDRDRPVTRV